MRQHPRSGKRSSLALGVFALAGWSRSAVAAPPLAQAPASQPGAGATVSQPLTASDFAGRGSPAALASAPLVLGETIIAAHHDAQLGGALVGVKRLYALDAEARWQVREWPDGVTPMYTFELGGTLWFVGKPGALYYRVDAQRFVRKVVSGIDPRTRELPWRRAWVSPDASRLWILAGFDRLVRIDLSTGLSTGAATVFHIPVGGGETRGGAILVGRATTQGDEILVAMGNAVYGLRGGEVRELARLEAPAIALHFDGETAGRAETEGGAQVIALEPGDAGASLDPLDPQSQRIYDAVSLAERMADHNKTMPGAETFWFPSFRVGTAAEFRFERPTAAFGLEVGVGMMLSPPTGEGPDRAHAQRSIEAWFWPEVGYSWSSDPRSLGHAAFAGIGFGLGNDFVAGYYKPRALVGAFDRGVAPGLRHGLGVQALWGALGVELSHTMAFGLGTGGDDINVIAHDLRVGLDINLVPIFWAVHLWVRR